MEATKRHLRFSALVNSKRKHTVENLQRLKGELKRHKERAVKEQIELLENIAKEDSARPLSISKAEKAAIIILDGEKKLYDEKEIQEAKDYLRKNPENLDEPKFISDADVLKVSMLAGGLSAPKEKEVKKQEKEEKQLEKKPAKELKAMEDKELLKYAKKYMKKSTAVTQDNLAKEYPELVAVLSNRKILEKVVFTKEQVAEIRKQLKITKEEGIPNRTALALIRAPLHTKALRAGILDEFYPEMERSKAGERQKYIEDNFGTEEKLMKIVEEHDVRTVRDFLCKVEYGANAYASNKQVRAILRKVLDARAAKPAAEKPEDPEKDTEKSAEMPAELAQADKAIENTDKAAEAQSIENFADRIKSFYNDEDALQSIVREFGVNSEQDFVTNVPFGKMIFEHSDFDRKLLNLILDYNQASQSVLVTSTSRDYVADMLAKLGCPKERIEEGVNSIVGERRFDMANKAVREKLRTKAIAFVADVSSQKKTSVEPAHKAGDLMEKGFFIPADELQKIADNTKLSLDDVKIHILSIIAGLKLGSQISAVGNGSSGAGLSESIVVKNIRLRLGRVDAPKSKVKPRNILKYLYKAGVFARKKDSGIYFLESDSEKVDPVWRNIVDNLMEQNRERRNSQY